jgi:hypothetical protein
MKIGSMDIGCFEFDKMLAFRSAAAEVDSTQ